MAQKKTTSSKSGKGRAGKKTAGDKKKPSRQPSAKKSSGTGSSNKQALLAITFLLAVAVAGLVVITSWPPPQAPSAPGNRIQMPTRPEEPVHYTEHAVNVEPTPVDTATTTPAGNQPDKIAIIMDDMGISLSHGTAAINLSIPLTCSIFPGERHSREIMELAHKRQREIMIHMPMEPVNYPRNNPGATALFVNQSDSEIVAITQQFIALSPYATGCNNHMGSAFTQHADKMDLVLRQIKQHHLFFIDSVTIAKSIAYREAQRLEVPSARRNIFLDNERDVDKILKQLNKLVKTAKQTHHAIGICHPYTETIAALNKFATTLNDKEIEVVPASQLVH